MNIANQQLKHALKEWAIAVDALTTGKTIVLLRKGGIREQDFQVKHSLVWLYPTYEHQKPELLKPKYSDVTTVKSGWHPERVTIKSCAAITQVFTIDRQSQVNALQPYHVWNEQMVGARWNWQPQRLLKVLLLRVYCLPQPHNIPFDQLYGGCKSWIDLIEPIDTDNLSPVLKDPEYEQIAQEIESVISNCRS